MAAEAASEEAASAAEAADPGDQPHLLHLQSQTCDVNSYRMPDVFSSLRALNVIIHNYHRGKIQPLLTAEQEGDTLGSRIKVLRSGTFFISYKNRSRLIDVKRIIYIKKDRRQMVFHIVSGRNGRIITEEIPVYGKFSDITFLLGKNYLWCHRSYIINMDGIYAFDGNDVILKTGERITLGRDIYRVTKNICMEYFEKKQKIFHDQNSLR